MANLLTGDAATFASGLADWNKTTGSGNFTLAHSTADGGVARVDVTTGGSNIALGSHTSGDPTKIPVTAGATITLGASCKQTNGTARGWQIEGTFYNSAGTNHSNVVSGSGTLTVGSYVTLSNAITVPADSVRMRLRVRWNSPATGEIFYLDNAVVDDGAGGGGGGGTPVNTGNTASYVRTSSAWVLLREDRIT